MLVWSGYNTPVMPERHICVHSESERATSSPGVVLVGPCMCCLLFPSCRQRPGYCCPYTCIVTVLRERPYLGHSVVSSLLDRHHSSHIASDTPGFVENNPSSLNTSCGKGAELLRSTTKVLFGKTNIKNDSLFCFAVTMSRWRQSC